MMHLSGRARVEILCKHFLLPVKLGGLVVEPDNWLPIMQLKIAISTIGKRHVSINFLKNVLSSDSIFALSEDGTKVKLTRIDDVGERYETPPDTVYATTTYAGLDAISKARLFNGLVSPDEPVDTSDVILLIKAQRAETLGAKFLRVRGEPKRLQAQDIPIECITAKRQL